MVRSHGSSGCAFAWRRYRTKNKMYTKGSKRWMKIQISRAGASSQKRQDRQVGPVDVNGSPKPFGPVFHQENDRAVDEQSEANLPSQVSQQGQGRGEKGNDQIHSSLDQPTPALLFCAALPKQKSGEPGNGHDPPRLSEQGGKAAKRPCRRQSSRASLRNQNGNGRHAGQGAEPMVGGVRLRDKCQAQKKQAGQIHRRTAQKLFRNHDARPCQTDSQYDPHGTGNPSPNPKQFEKQQVKHLGAWKGKLEKVPIDHLALEHFCGFQ